MTEATAATPVARRGPDPVVVTGAGALSAYGLGTEALLSGVLCGRPAFGPVDRFDVGIRRVRVAATLPGSPDLTAETARAINQACDDAGLKTAERSRSPLFLAVHGDPELARLAAEDRVGLGPDALTARVSGLTGLASNGSRCYMSACVAASTAIADAAATIAAGRAARVVVAAGFLVDPDSFALFDGGRVLARDGQCRPFSSGRQGMLLGDGVAAVVLESGGAARARGASPLARLAGWGRAGDAYHVCQPSPDGRGLARAIGAALRRGRTDPADIDYVNAGGTGTSQGDSAEAAALRRALGSQVDQVAVSSTKSVHGHALEASGLLEFVLTVGVLRAGLLPPNAGYLGPDPECDLNLVLGPAREVPGGCRHALSVNAAFGGANTALLVAAP
jgi:3-oxoacyl-[acyl-carrier-protein] synthase II